MNKNIILALVVVIVLGLFGYYYMDNLNMNTNTTSSIKTDTKVDNSNKPEDVSASVENFDSTKLDAQLDADLKSIEQVIN